MYCEFISFRCVGGWKDARSCMLFVIANDDEFVTDPSFEWNYWDDEWKVDGFLHIIPSM